MGRTLPSITNAFLHEQQSLARFRRALRRSDQRALDDLFGASRHHLAAAAYASHLLPFEIMLLSMLVEEHKLVLQLQIGLERLQLHLGLETTPPTPSDEPIAALSERHAFDLREGSPPYPADAAPPDLPERKRKWWAGG